MVGILINGKPATAEEEEKIYASFVESIFNSMTEQEKTYIVEKFIYELKKKGIL